MIKLTNLKLSALLFVILCVGCGMFSGPSATVKNLESSLQDGRVDDAVKLFSARKIQNLGGLDETRKLLAQQAEIRRQAKASTGKSAGLNNLKEVVNGDTAQVSYQLSENWQGGFPFKIQLVKENGEWKIDDVEGGN